jgi:methionyl-tRNA formyltransferase
VSDVGRLRIVMLGTGDFAVPTFERLASGRHAVVALFTQPERPRGRRQELVPARIKERALELGVAVEQPEDVNAAEGIARVAAHAPDLLVTAAYGQILSAALLGVPRLGGINLHGSVLPAYRGAAPVARAIERGETETGVTVIQMTPRVDAGGMIAVARTSIDPDETAGVLEARLSVLGAPLVEQAIESILAGTAVVLPQDPALVSKAPKLRKDDGVIDWSRPARAIHDRVRAMQPWPQAATLWQPAGGDRPPARWIVHRTEVEDAGGGPPGTVLEAAGDRLIVAAGEGAVRLVEIQVVGRKPLDTAAFLRGVRCQPGDRLTVAGDDRNGS